MYRDYFAGISLVLYLKEQLIYGFMKEYLIRIKALSFPLRTKATNLLLANTVIAGVASLACYSMALLAGLCFNKLI